MAMILAMGGCHRSPRLPSDLSVLVDQTERIELDFEPPSNKYLPLAQLETGSVRLGDYNVRSSFHRDVDRMALFDLRMHESNGPLIDLTCIHNLRSLSRNLVEWWDCENKPSGLHVHVEVSGNMVYLMVYEFGKVVLKSEMRPRRVLTEGSTVTTLFGVQASAETNDGPPIAPRAAIVAKGQRLSLYVPRAGEMRRPALVALLLTVLIRPPYLGLSFRDD